MEVYGRGKLLYCCYTGVCEHLRNRDANDRAPFYIGDHGYCRLCYDHVRSGLDNVPVTVCNKGSTGNTESQIGDVK